MTASVAPRYWQGEAWAFRDAAPMDAIRAEVHREVQAMYADLEDRLAEAIALYSAMADIDRLHIVDQIGCTGLAVASHWQVPSNP